jgi:hypothetical protein
VQNILFENLQKQHLRVEVSNGVVVGVEGSNEQPTNPSIYQKIMEVIDNNEKVRKKDLYNVIQELFGVSPKTVQRTIKELETLGRLQSDYNNVWKVSN